MRKSNGLSSESLSYCSLLDLRLLSMGSSSEIGASRYRVDFRRSRCYFRLTKSLNSVNSIWLYKPYLHWVCSLILKEPSERYSVWYLGSSRRCSHEEC